MNTNLQIDTNKKLIHPDLSYEIVGICFDVHNELGSYAREKQYSDKLEERLKIKNIFYEREYAISNSGNIVDFIIENKIVLELKTSRMLTREHFRQIQNYLQQSKIDLGLLINFSDKYLKPRRIVRIESKNS